MALGLGTLGHPVRLATLLGHDALDHSVQGHLGSSGVELS
ncbi:sugar/nucleoside kinase (ribokinase family) [Streptomyces sp. SAI-218]